MSDKINDGGPAFAAGDFNVQPGMSLRDYFAIHSIPAVIHQADKMFNNPESWSVEDYASQAYRIADAMLAQREKANAKS